MLQYLIKYQYNSKILVLIDEVNKICYKVMKYINNKKLTS